jgi:N-acetylneuraminic acid mutarotase
MVGGVDAGNPNATPRVAGNSVATCEIYDPAKNTITATGSMGTARAGHAAALLNDGRVLVAGGNSDLSTVLNAISSMLKTCEIYDPKTNAWTSTASVKEKIIGPSLTTLANGKVLIAGGAQVNSIFSIPTSVTSQRRCQLYTPGSGGSGTWATTGSMTQDRSVHTSNTIRLQNGRVLVTGGLTVSINVLQNPPSLANTKSTDMAEYFDPTTSKWVALPNLAVSRMSHTVNEMPNGRVLIVGGASGVINTATSVNSVQEFDPATNTFPRSFTLKNARATHGSAVLQDGTMVVFGGLSSASATLTLKTLEIVHQ